MIDKEQLWVSATATRNHLLRNPLIDWLNLFGEANGFIRDADLADYDERLEFVPFIMRKGVEFEAAVVAHMASQAPMITIAQSRDDVHGPLAAERTLEALAEGQP